MLVYQEELGALLFGRLYLVQGGGVPLCLVPAFVWRVPFYFRGVRLLFFSLVFISTPSIDEIFNFFLVSQMAVNRHQNPTVQPVCPQTGDTTGSPSASELQKADIQCKGVSFVVYFFGLNCLDVLSFTNPSLRFSSQDAF